MSTTVRGIVTPQDDMEEEIFEGLGGLSMDLSQMAEVLFDQLQKTMLSLVKKYEIEEGDLKSSFDVIEKLWELLQETQSSYEMYKEKLSELEEQWNEEKEKIRAIEKRKADLENRLDEERYHWQNERQELNREKAALVTKNKHLTERNNDLISEMKKQKDQFDENQKMRDEIMNQYKKQYEIAKTSSLRRSKSRSGSYNQFPPPIKDFSPSRKLPNPTPRQRVLPPRNDSRGSHTLTQSIKEESTEATTPPTKQKHNLPLKSNKVSLKTELANSEANTPSDEEYTVNDDMELMEDYNQEFDSIAFQEELLNVNPDLLAPAAAELELLRKEQEEMKKENQTLQNRFETIREEKEELESDNVLLGVEIQHYKIALQEIQNQMALLRQERDEILETYLEQPFDVYCVTKKELHEVLKKLHDTQLEVHRQNEEQQMLKLQLERRKKKKFWKKFKEKFRSAFNRPHRSDSPVDTPPEVVTSLQLPPETNFTPKRREELAAISDFYTMKSWLIPKEGLLSPDTLPSLYCQLTLKEYHVTERINCIALGQVYHSSLGFNPSPSNRKHSLLPLAARTPKGYLSAEVWVASSEGLASFVEVIDVLAKKVTDRFLVKGTKVLAMMVVPGCLPPERLPTTSSISEPSPSMTSKAPNDQLDCDPNWFASSPIKDMAKNVSKKSNSLFDEVFQDEQGGSSSPQNIHLSQGSSSGSTPDMKKTRELSFKNQKEFIPPKNQDQNIDNQNMEVYSDEEPDIDTKDDENIPKHMWIISDDGFLYIFSLTTQHNKALKIVNLPTNPSTINYFEGKVFIGLCDSKLLVYHNESIVYGNTWDFDHPSIIELPVINPDYPPPIQSVELVNKRLWIATGGFISLIDVETFSREGMRFLESIQNVINKLMLVNDVVIATILKGPHFYVLDSIRAEVVQKIDLSPTSSLIDNLLSFTDIDITSVTCGPFNVFIGTSLGKIVCIPLSYFTAENLKSSKESLVYPPEIKSPYQNKLFTVSGVSLHSHRDGPVQGLVHIQLPKGISGPLSTSTLNLTNLSSNLSNASSLSNLLDSPPTPRAAAKSYPLYNSLLVSGGKGHMDYINAYDVFQESTAIRERNDAFQLLVWGFDQSSN